MISNKRVFSLILFVVFLATANGFSSNSELSLHYSILEARSDDLFVTGVMRVTVFNPTAEDLSEVRVNLAQPGLVHFPPEALIVLPAGETKDAVGEFSIEKASLDSSRPLLWQIEGINTGKDPVRMIVAGQEDEGGN